MGVCVCVCVCVFGSGLTSAARHMGVSATEERGSLLQLSDGTTLDKKNNHPRDSRREEHCSRCDIMLDEARLAQGKSRGQSRIVFALS